MSKHLETATRHIPTQFDYLFFHRRITESPKKATPRGRRVRQKLQKGVSLALRPDSYKKKNTIHPRGVYHLRHVREDQRCLRRLALDLPSDREMKVFAVCALARIGSTKTRGQRREEKGESRDCRRAPAAFGIVAR